jgi:eukaryotic-like serine/threonine-protein kinase
MAFQFRRAAELDPKLAAARVQAMAWTDINDDARTLFREASLERASLTERDRGLLDAIEARVLRIPPDNVEYSRRLKTLAAKYPGDAQLHALAGPILRASEAVGFLKRAIELDPDYKTAYAWLANRYLELGEFERSADIAEQCLRRGPSHNCLAAKADILMIEGRCDELEAVAKNMIAMNPGFSGGRQTLAIALSSTGRPVQAVRALMEAAPKGEGEAYGKWFDPSRFINLAFLEGDFELVLRLVAEFEASIAQDRSRGLHRIAAMFRILALTEAGRPGEAAAVAASFMEKRDAWVVQDPGEDLVPEIIAFMFLAGKMTRIELVQRTDAWARTTWRDPNPLDEFHEFNAWMRTWPVIAHTPELAREVISRRPASRPVPAKNATLYAIDIGRAYVLAGDPDEALRWLLPFSRNCNTLDMGLQQLPSQVWLGKAFEAKGDKQGACAAYKVLLDRWGKAKPRSVSADEARARSKALGCGR